MRVTFDDREIAKLAGQAAPLVEDIGEQVADRAQLNARRRFRESGGGGIASIRARMVHDQYGVHSEIGWNADHYYMAFHEFGTSHEPPRPFLRPALFAVRKATGGAKAGPIGRIRSNRAATARTRRAREFHRSRR